MASTSSITNSFITRCLSLSKAHYFYCIKIRTLYKTSLMFLWELKNAIISTKSPWTLCYRNSKTKQKNSTHSGFDKLSHQFFYYTLPERSRRHILTSNLGAWACRRHIISIALNPCTLLNISDVPLRTQKRHYFTKSSWTSCYKKSTHNGFDKLNHQFFYYTVPEPVEGTLFLLY